MTLADRETIGALSDSDRALLGCDRPFSDSIARSLAWFSAPVSLAGGSLTPIAAPLGRRERSSGRSSFSVTSREGCVSSRNGEVAPVEACDRADGRSVSPMGAS